MPYTVTFPTSEPMCSAADLAAWLIDRGEPHQRDGDVVAMRAIPVDFVAGDDQEALRCQIQVTSTVSLSRIVDTVFDVSVRAGADVHLVGVGPVNRAALWMRFADEQDRLRVAESLERAAQSSHRDEIMRRMWGVLAAARSGHDDRWDAQTLRIVELLEVGDGISLEDAAWHADEPAQGDVISVPVQGGMLHCLLWRWLSEAYPGIAEAEHTLH